MSARPSSAADPVPWATALVAAAAQAGEDVDAALRLAAEFGHLLPMPGGGGTVLRWGVLADVAQADLTAVRILEAHSDALAILEEAGDPAAGDLEVGGTWGVFAAEAPGVRLDARHRAGRWRLDGTKPWCSLGGRLDHALVTAHVDGGRRLFAVDLDPSVVVAEPASGWVSRGLRNIPSGPVHFHSTPARPVGATGWYLSRDGFAWGGIGVAACWLGGARALANTLREKASGRDDAVLYAQLGAVDTAVYTAGAAMTSAASDVDRGAAAGPAGELLALRARSAVAAAAELTLRLVGHALGPSVLAFDEIHARRVADLGIYLRQHHGEQDLATLGRLLLRGGQ
jgi:alkylation response protein AidB-like acyl-CoA dehydrogenase